MKKLFLILFLATFFVIPQSVSADLMDTHSENIDEVLAEILQAQNVNELSQLECDKITEGQFERLGDAWMGVMHPDDIVHESMDKMMGGEGSESLRRAHISMGQRYLGCGSTGGSSMGVMMGMPMMGMMNWGGGDSNMMSWGLGSIGLFGWVFMILFWSLLILGIVALIKWIAVQGKPGGEKSGQSPLEILKTRYAKGEINKKEYEEMKKELKNE